MGRGKVDVVGMVKTYWNVDVEKVSIDLKELAEKGKKPDTNTNKNTNNKSLQSRYSCKLGHQPQQKIPN